MTALFSKYPSIINNGESVKNITIRLDFIDRIKNNVAVFQYINVGDQDTPESLAYKYYGNPELFWIILYLNNVVDPFYDWILSEDRLYDYCVRKYGVENVYNIHHYETTSEFEHGAGFWVDFGTPFSSPVTNYSYEQTLNENKRKIKILKPFYLQQILTEYDRILKTLANS